MVQKPHPLDTYFFILYIPILAVLVWLSKPPEICSDSPQLQRSTAALSSVVDRERDVMILEGGLIVEPVEARDPASQ